MSKAKKQKDVYQEVTNKIIEALEQDIVPWERPWTGSKFRCPTSASTGKSYNGINNLILTCQSSLMGYKSNQWVTYGQAEKLGGKVKTGEKGTIVTYYKSLRIKDKDAETTTDTDDSDNTKVIPMLKYFVVFNLDQTDGLDKLTDKEFIDVKPNEITANELADVIAASTCAIIKHDGGDRAFYRPDSDSIHLPERQQFKGEHEYYSTLLHELTHWTKHPDRCDRNDGYAFEELVAEIGAAFMCNHVGFDYSSQHTSYLKSWLQALKDDKKFIFRASSKARKASEHILSYYEMDQLAEHIEETTTVVFPA